MDYKNGIVSFFHPCYRKMAALLRKSRLLVYLLFGVRSRGLKRLVYWDWVTLCLRKALKRDDLHDRRFLDMGCGYAAVLSILAYRRNCRAITAVDVDHAAVSSAREFLSKSGAEVRLLQGDLGENLPDGTYHLISFNSPYIPEKWGERQRLQSSRSSWSGGKDGTEVIGRFARQIPAYMAPGGKILLGFNTFYVNAQRVLEIVQANGLTLNRVIKLPLVKSQVFELIRGETNEHIGDR
jgi:methylase of polypeptide subunit release factors